MKKRLFYSSLILLILSGCTFGFKRGPKKYIKSLQISTDDRIDWYVYGSMSGPGPGYLQFSDDTTSYFFTSFYLSDISLKRDSLMISLSGPDYELMNNFNRLKIFIDTIGGSWNGAEARIDRLHNREIDISHPHFVDVACPKPDCK